MKHHIYVLYSKVLDRFYTGITSDDIQSRLHKHNVAFHGKHRFTAKGRPWTLFLHFECQNRSQALAIESHIKRMKSKKYIMNLQAYPDMIKKLRNRYKHEET